MNSRVDKYYEKESAAIGSRTQRNNELYKEISKTDIDGYELRSNATVIGNNSNNIDVEKIKSILDTHYNDTPKRRTIPLDENTTSFETPQKKYETKEYDINVILDKAKAEKEESYDEERVRKMHNTQFDILKSLDLESKRIEEEDKDDALTTPDATARQLEDLINTISINEKEFKKNKDKIVSEKNDITDPLDIFADLKGGDNTTVLEGLQEKTEEVIKKMEQTNLTSTFEDTESISEKTSNTSFDNTFFTKSNAIKDHDFEDFRDIDDGEGPGVFVKVLIALLLIAFIIGIGFLVKTLL